jgi:nucleoside permease NupC
MSLVHLHLLLNHVPVVGLLFVVLLLVLALSRRSSELGKTALGALAGLALVAAIVFLTGEPAEEAVEKVAGVSDAMIHSHEEAAETALVAIALTGGLALVALQWFRRRSLPRWIMTTALFVTLATGGIMAWTANLGGQIRHTEIGGGATSGVPDDDRDR